jgi:L,D-transpeptidase catalytic domain/Putative peptidoglycan binding domain
VKRALALAVALTLLAPAAAVAQTPTATPTPTPVPPTPTPTPTPVPPTPTPTPVPPPLPQITMAAEKVYAAGDKALVLRGHAYRVRGTMLPVAAVPQQLELRVFRTGKVVRRLHVAVAPDGSFKRRIPAGRKGTVGLRALHAATPELGAAIGPKLKLTVVEPRLAEGSRGLLVPLLQRGLSKLDYAITRTGTFDAATARAVMAFRKVNELGRSYEANQRVIEKVLAGKGAFKPRFPGAGRHVEADISRQVLALIDDGGKVVATYHTSTGAPATPTIIGSFRVYLKTPGTNAKGMVDSNYFIRGYAIHGYFDVPAFNASHGCLRIPIADAARVYGWLRIGDRVITYP